MSTDALLERIARALERMAPPAALPLGLEGADAFLWQAESLSLLPVAQVDCVALELLRGIDRAKETLLDNSLRFSRGLPANNALLWGARGMGKSSLVKAVHRAVNETARDRLALVEIHREDIATLPVLMRGLRAQTRRVILFCDDLTFEGEDAAYKSLKAALDGGIEGRPPHVLFYATSNRRHLLPRRMIENEQANAINPSEATEEKVSLSDRFGLWIGFHPCAQDEFLTMVAAYVAAYGLRANEAEWKPQAIEWAATRGARSGRVAWQFIQDLAGRLGQRLD